MALRTITLAAGFLFLVGGQVGADEKPTSSADKPADDAAALFSSLDANGDGKLAPDEVPQEKQKLVKRLLRTADKNDDNLLDAEEFAAGVKSSRPDRPLEKPAESLYGKAGNLPQAMPEMMFKRLDANGDGKVVPDEVPEERRENFRRMVERIDRNGDGGLSQEEFAKVREKLAAAGLVGKKPGDGAKKSLPEAGGEALFALLDANDDGSITSDELTRVAEKLKSLDRDGDGKLSRREFAARDGQDAVRGEKPSREGGRLAPEMLLKRADTNGDGKISRDEAPERLQRVFDRVDSNGDGSLDAPELRRGLARMAKRDAPNADSVGKKAKSGE